MGVHQVGRNDVEVEMGCAAAASSDILKSRHVDTLKHL